MEIIARSPGIRVQVQFKAGSLERISLFSSPEFSLDCPSAHIEPFRAWLKAYSQGQFISLPLPRRQLQNSPPQKNRPFESFCLPTTKPYSPEYVLGGGVQAAWRPRQTDSKSSILLGRGVLQLPPIPIDTFQGDVLRFLQTIPWGSVCSYKDVAKAVGSPRAARAVGNICRGNLFPLLIPCHRVIRSDGEIGRYTPDPSLKRQLLYFEGVTFSKTS
jgi:O-6-methylguanine DNA methyltransferase